MSADTTSKRGSDDRRTAPEFGSRPIPAAAGIGLRTPHVDEVIATTPDVAWLEVHSENYLVAGGPRRRELERVRANYPLCCHSVGLSLGSSDGLDETHLAGLRALYDDFEPGLVSDHVAWTATGGHYLNDLLPLPYTEEALGVICRNVDHAQERLGRQMLVENPSSYMTFPVSSIPEAEFVAEIARRTGCGILLDVNNIYVSSTNLGIDPDAYLETIPREAVGEIHIAGHSRRDLADGEAVDGPAPILIDDHSSAPNQPVWDLLDRALARFGPMPVLMEWDGDIPDLSVLLSVADQAQAALDRQTGPGKAVADAA